MLIEIRTSLITQLEAVETFDDAGLVTWKLSEIDGMTPEDINHMLKIASVNNQVYGSGSASHHIGRLVSEHRKNIKKRVLGEFYKARGGPI